MSRRRKAAAKGKADKAKRRQASQHSSWLRRWPYLAVGGVAAVFIAALFLIGGGGSSTAAVYPDGYEPPTLGSPDAPVEMVMWEDFQCPFCGRFELRTMPVLKERFVDSGQLRVVWRNFENYGGESRDAAIAVYCAGEQGQFWEFKDILFREQQGINQGTFSENNLRRFAEEAGLETTAFNACLDGRSYESIIVADKQLGRSEFNIAGTPTFFINGLRVGGAQPTDTFVGIIEDALRRAGQ